MEKGPTELSTTAEGTCSSDKAHPASVGNTGQLESHAAVGALKLLEGRSIDKEGASPQRSKQN